MIEKLAVGLFLIPAKHLHDMYELARLVEESHATNKSDVLYRETQLFVGGSNMASASVIIKGDVSWRSASALDAWLSKCYLDRAYYKVFVPPLVQKLRSALANVEFHHLKRWLDRRKRTHVDHDMDQLRTLFAGLKDLLARARPRRHGLAIGLYSPDELKPPEPLQPLQGPELSPEDNEQYNRNWDRMAKLMRTQGLNDEWYELPIDGRMLLGFLPPEEGPSWRQRWEAIDALHQESRYRTVWLQYADFVRELEPVLREATVLTMAGPVSAHTWLIAAVKLPLDHIECTEIISPERLDTVARRFAELEAEEGTRRELLNQLWRTQAYWPKKLVHAEYKRIRTYLAQAQERGWWLVWMHDKFTESSTIDS